MELPLVFFTVLTQLVTGAVITLWLLDTFTDRVQTTAGRAVARTIPIITAVALLISLLHLGHPLNAYRALANIGSSWISREVALFSLFFLLSIVYFLKWNETDQGSRKTIGGITALVAFLAMTSSAMIYVIPSHPAWDNFSTVLFFWLSTAILGPLYVSAAFKFCGQSVPASAGFTGAVLVTSLITYLLYASVLLTGQPESILTGQQIFQSWAFWVRLVLEWLVPIAILIFLASKKTLAQSSFMTYIFVMVLVGEIVGRGLFFSSAVAYTVAAF